MKSLGSLSKITKNGNMLIRTKELPSIYSNIVTADKKNVGKIIDIIGPIMDPHVVVKPNRQILEKSDVIRGKELFEMKRQKKKRDGKWQKKRSNT